MRDLVKGGFIVFAFLSLINTSAAHAQRYGAYGLAPRAKSFRLGTHFGLAFRGDDQTKKSSNYRVGLAGGLDVTYLFHPRFGAGAFAGIGTLASDFGGSKSSTFFGWYGTHLEGRIIAQKGKTVPFLFIRLGGVTHKPSLTSGGVTVESETETVFAYGGGAGVEFMIYRGRKPLYLRLMLGGTLTNSDKLDNIESGDRHDGFSFLSVGLSYYIGRR
ncbi:MAG: hypothetical protein QHI48_05995 [Bacteroidota bacterium]|nr:hypothetical protein [Bacteroidota bacterium]